jgi:hypothetical protein
MTASILHPLTWEDQAAITGHLSQSKMVICTCLEKPDHWISLYRPALFKKSTIILHRPTAANRGWLVT